MKEFISILGRYLPSYKKFIVWAIVLNILTALLGVFSYSLIGPILDILFKVEKAVYEYIPLDAEGIGIGDIVMNNIYYYMNQLIDRYGQSLTLLLLGVFLAVMTLLKASTAYGASAVMIPIRMGIIRDIRIQLYNKILSLPMAFFSEERKGDIIARMSGDVNEVEVSVTGSLNMLMKNPILIVIYLTTLILISWQLTLFAVVILPLLAWVMGLIGKKLKRQSLEAQAKWSENMSQVEETLGGLRVIKAFIAEKKMSQRYVKNSNEFKRLISKVGLRQELAHPLSEFLGTLIIVLVLWFGGTLILKENAPIDASSFIRYMVILYLIINPLKEFSKAGYSIPKGLASMERIDKILMAENTMKEAEHPTPLHSFNQQIEFRNVSFSYGTHEVLKNINLTIENGKTIALVGQSGSGKSTLVDLIPRYHDVAEGEILIDGIDIRDVSLSDLRGLIGNVNQEAILFNDTFYNNITFGVESATMEQVIEAAKIANAHDFIIATENGYHTNIGDRGGKLSGGQRQRVSIARAILKNPPILILDEATSALDTESERLVQEALERLMNTRTTIAIAHRLSTIKNSDEICVLYEGEIVERGCHNELLALNGYYKKLNDMQSL